MSQTIAIPVLNTASGGLIKSADWNNNFTTIQSFINGGNMGASNWAVGVVGASGNLDLNSHIVDNSTLAMASNQLSIKTGGVTATQIANNTITATQIANATITGTQIGSSVNLAGNAVQENGLNVLVSAVNSSTSLSVVWGKQKNVSAYVDYGTGFSIVNNSTGNYTVTFTNAFASKPAVLLTAVNVSAGKIALVTAGPTTTTFDFTIFNISGTPVDGEACFMAVGPR